jgi:integrase
MKDTIFTSTMAPYIEGFLNQKRALGYKYDVEEYNLLCFDKYWSDTNGDIGDFTIETLSGWMKQRPTEGKSTQALRISVVKQLALYLNGLGKESYIPMDRIRCPRPVVHILTVDEITDLFRVIDSFRPRRQSPGVTRMADGYRVIFRLILTTGLRRCEAVGLRIQDINWDNNSISIYNAKGHKDRVVFMAEDFSALLKEYITRNQLLMNTEWVFPAADPSRHFSGGALAIRFRQFWNETRFASDAVKTPTIHSLRHTYVVMRMNAWMAQGVDLDVMLPYLSRALGHKSTNETYYYYHQVIEAFRLIREKDRLAATVFPEVRIR